jgi:hypothetical protein
MRHCRCGQTGGRGEVANARVLRSSDPGLEAPSLDAVRLGKFRAERKAGRAAASRRQEYFKFAIGGR